MKRAGCASPSTRSASGLAQRSRRGAPLSRRDSRNWREKLSRPLHPPGRDVRCIVSVGMLTEGWDCNTVTHIIGLAAIHVAAAVRAGGRPRPAAGEL